MAITLNKQAKMCEKAALQSGRITPDSPAGTFLYDISRHWRRLIKATNFISRLGRWSEKEVCAGEVIISAVTYLQRLGCTDIEQLLRDTMEQKTRLK